MVITRHKPTIHTFEGFQFVPGINIVPDELGRKIIGLDRFKEQVKKGFMEITEEPADDESESADTLVALLATKNARDAKNIVKETLDITALRAVLDEDSSEERSTVIAAVEDQIEKLEEGRDDNSDDDSKD